MAHVVKLQVSTPTSLITVLAALVPVQLPASAPEKKGDNDLMTTHATGPGPALAVGLWGTNKLMEDFSSCLSVAFSLKYISKFTKQQYIILRKNVRKKFLDSRLLQSYISNLAFKAPT